MALHQRKWNSLPLSLLFLFVFLIFSCFFSFSLSYSLSHRGWIWVPEGLELGPERACFPLSLYFWRPTFATLFIPCTLIRGNSPADCDAEKNWFCFLRKSLEFCKDISMCIGFWCFHLFLHLQSWILHYLFVRGLTFAKAFTTESWIFFNVMVVERTDCRKLFPCLSRVDGLSLSTKRPKTIGGLWESEKYQMDSL